MDRMHARAICVLSGIVSHGRSGSASASRARSAPSWSGTPT
jgi:hypothetical protein